MAERLGSFLRWSTALATVVAGLAFAGTPPASAQASSIGINFDNHGAPCDFIDTHALHSQYAAQGVLFAGPGPGLANGGGVLNECGNFGVTGFSAPNFLAFNSGAPFADGGLPEPPETIAFTSGPVSHVQINAGSAEGGNITLNAYNTSHQLLASSHITMTSALATLSVDASGIDGVKIVTSASIFVLDDLQAS